MKLILLFLLTLHIPLIFTECNTKKEADCGFDYYKCSVDENNKVKCQCLLTYYDCMNDADCLNSEVIKAIEQECHKLDCRNCTFYS